MTAQENFDDKVLKAHKKHSGKIEIFGKVPILTNEDLLIYYTPGVAQVSLAIKNNISNSYEYTNRANTVAIVTDGSRVLGLGDIGPEAEMPVIEGKSLLFKKFGGIDAIPLAIRSTGEDDVVKFTKMLEPSVAAINVEDIKSPKVFNITKRLEEEMHIPVFHDDKDGTAIVARAALINALKLSKKRIDSAKIVINGAGSAGFGIANILHQSGASDIVVCDTHGAIYKNRTEDMNDFKEELAQYTNKNTVKGELQEVAEGADVIIGVSSKGAFSQEIINKMNDKPIVFALANPYPEISYHDAKSAGAFIIATGRSDTPNQVNNYIAFPGFFRGVLSSRARTITKEMIIAASDAIAKSVKKKQLSTDYIIPNISNPMDYTAMTVRIAISVAEAALKSGASSAPIDKTTVKKSIKEILRRYKKIEKYIDKFNKESSN
jgi:malate dehydrogenase (oxaloacetate-decarboxylating)